MTIVKDAKLSAELYWGRSVLRAEREETLWLYLEDMDDTRPALEVELALPQGLTLLDRDVSRAIPASAWDRRPVHISGDAPRTVRELHASTRVSWRVRAAQACTGLVEARISGENIATTRAVATATFTPPLAPRNLDYVPEPQPAKPDRYVGMINCPLWKPGEHYGWHMMERTMPWRKPALGWYDESLPEVTDWEIKWLLEHGVNFIMYCWYREFGNEGKPLEVSLSHGIHEGLFGARYGDQIDFAIMWTNNQYSGVASRDDLMRNLVPFWIETYFKRPNYLMIDNKPVLGVYDVQRLMKDMGGAAATSETLNLMREACVAAGFDGLWILGESRHWWPDYLKMMAECGFDASFAYAWNNVPDGASDTAARETIMSNLRGRAEWGHLPDVPTVSAMWDPSLWEQYMHPDQISAHYHMTPDAFRGLCEDVKALTADLPATDSLARRMLLVDNWNEWGEGHYLAPCREHGFDYLDVIRSVFTDAPDNHVDLIPEDVGLGPYEEAYEAWLDKMTEAAAESPQP